MLNRLVEFVKNLGGIKVVSTASVFSHLSDWHS